MFYRVYKCPVFSGAEHLVGYSGKVSFKKLKPLKRSRTDKIQEKSLEQDYLDRVGFLNIFILVVKIMWRSGL